MGGLSDSTDGILAARAIRGEEDAHAELVLHDLEGWKHREIAERLELWCARDWNYAQMSQLQGVYRPLLNAGGPWRVWRTKRTRDRSP